MNELRDAIERVEARLVAAQRDGDLAELDELLHADLAWTAPDGSTGGRQVDLQAHRDGVFVIRKLEVVSRVIDVITPDVAIARIVVDAEGEPMSGTIACTRVWQRSDDRWQVRSAHLSMLG